MGKGGGGGKGRGGKSRGKMAVSIIGGVVGGIGVGWGAGVFGTTKVFQSVMYGLSLGSTIGSAFFSKADEEQQANTQNFDNKMNTVDSSAMLPLIYGTRKAGGLQTYHKSDVTNKKLRKHILMAEGEVDNIYGVTANGYLIPYRLQGQKDFNSSPVVCSITNIKDPSATFSIANGKMSLNANGHIVEIQLQNIEQLAEDGTNDYRCSFGALYQYFLGDNYENTLLEDGWKILNPVATDEYPSKINPVGITNAYNKVIDLTVGNLFGKESNCTVYFGDGDDSIIPETYMSTGGYPSIAYTDSTLKYCEQIGAGNPTITAIVKGKKCYDWRTKETKYTENPVVCLYDYLTNPIYGLGGSINASLLDMDSFTDVANYCDETVKYTNLQGIVVEEPRYRLNLILSQAQSHQDNIKAILRTFSGFIIFSNNKIKLCCERMQTPVYAFNDDNIVEKSIAYKSASIDQSPNRINVNYVEPVLDYTSVRCIVEDLVNQQPAPYGRGRVIETDISLDGVIHQSQALRLGKIYRDIIRLCPISVIFKTGAMACMLEAGDVITVSKTYIDENGEKQILFDNVQARIQEIKEDKGTYEITARQYNQNIYDDSFGASLHGIPTNVTDKDINLRPDFEIPKIDNLVATPIYAGNVAGQDYYNVRITWTVSDDTKYLGARVYYRIKDSENKEGSWSSKLIEGGMGKTEVLIPQIPSNSVVRFYVYGVSLDGLEKGPMQMTEKTILANNVVPLAPENCKLDITRDVATVTWNRVSNTDIQYYEIRLDDNIGSDKNLLAKTSSTLAIVNLLERQDTIYVYAINTSGVYSTPSVIEYNYLEPAKPKDVTVTSSVTGLSISCTASPIDKCIYVYYINGTKYTSSTNIMFFQLKSGAYKVSMSFSDYFGEGSKSEEIVGIVEKNIPTELIDKDAIGLTRIEDSMSKFDNELGSFKEDVSGMQSKMVQLSDGIQQSVKNTNNQIESKITQLNDDINLKIEDSTSGEHLISQINLTSTGTRIDGKLLHVTGDALFDNNIIANGMIQAGAITADKLSANVLTGQTITGDQIKGGTIEGTTIKGVNIQGSRIDAESLYQSGMRIKAMDSALYTVYHNNPIPELLGFNRDECIYVPAGAYGLPALRSNSLPKEIPSNIDNLTSMAFDVSAYEDVGQIQGGNSKHGYNSLDLYTRVGIKDNIVYVFQTDKNGYYEGFLKVLVIGVKK